MVVVWGLFISPKARFWTGLHGRAALGFLVFTIAALGLYARGQTRLGVTYWVLALASSLLLVALPE